MGVASVFYVLGECSHFVACQMLTLLGICLYANAVTINIFCAASVMYYVGQSANVF